MFECDKCGLCCMHINGKFVDFGLDRGDGVCRYFDDNTKLCLIYSQRPIICNVDEFYNSYYTGKMTKEEFYKLNYEGCRELKERYEDK